MILFFGVRPLKAKTTQLAGVSCPYCHQKNTLEASEIPHYFHLFWIPVFKAHTAVQASCSYCKKGFYKDEFSNEMSRALQTRARETK